MHTMSDHELWLQVRHFAMPGRSLMKLLFPPLPPRRRVVAVITTNTPLTNVIVLDERRLNGPHPQVGSRAA